MVCKLVCIDGPPDKYELNASLKAGERFYRLAEVHVLTDMQNRRTDRQKERKVREGGERDI